MPRFAYEVLDAHGKIIKGLTEAKDPVSLVSRLHQDGLFVVSINEEGRILKKGLFDYLPRVRSLIERIKLDLLVIFTSQLAVMINAGINILRALTSIANTIGNRRFKEVIEKVKNDIEGGTSLCDALSRYPHIFGPLYVYLVRAGEVSGKLDTMLEHLSVYLERTAILRRKVKGAMTYPILIVCFAILAVFILMWKVVPIFIKFYEQMGVAPPLPTRILVGVSMALREYTFLVFLEVFVAGLLLWGLTRRGKGRLLLDKFKLKMPVFGPLIKKTTLARFCRTLSMLMGSGVGILEALELVGKVSVNTVVEIATKDCIMKIENGESLSESMRKTGVFPEMVTQMAATGEETGTLPSMLAKAADYYELQVETTINALTSIIEPILIVSIGVVVSFIVISIFYPIFKLSKVIKPH